MQGQNFAGEDRLDTPRFNAALWRGLADGPEPQARNGADLRANRASLLQRAAAGRVCSGS
jgi:hypothetical protein